LALAHLRISSLVHVLLDAAGKWILMHVVLGWGADTVFNLSALLFLVSSLSAATAYIPRFIFSKFWASFFAGWILWGLFRDVPGWVRMRK